MARTRIKFPFLKAGEREKQLLTGEITLGSSGAISSVAGFLPLTTTAGAFGTIKTAAKTGRYSNVLDRKYKTVRLVSVNIIGPTDAAFGNTNANLAQFRNRTTNSFDIQLMLASTGADTDGASGTIIEWTIEVREF